MPEMLIASIYMQNLIRYFIGVLLLPIVQMLNCLMFLGFSCLLFSHRSFVGFLSLFLTLNSVLILEQYCNIILALPAFILGRALVGKL